MFRGFCCGVGIALELGVGVCEFYERRWWKSAGEVWVDVLRLFFPYLWAFPVENTPGQHVKKSAIFHDGRIIESAPTIIRTSVLF